MKKILLSLGFFSLVLVGRSQTALNEVYVQPSSTNEFFELYYSGPLPLGDNVNCWTIVTYYEEPGKTGFYVMDLPSLNVGSFDRYLVGASSDPFTAQGSSNVVPDFNWNAMPATGKLTKWERSGSGYVDATATIPANFNDFFYNKGGGGFNYAIMIFVNGVFSNGFLGGSNSPTSAILNGMPDLALTTANSQVCADFTIDFSTLGAFENVNAAAGTDNGYIRDLDGKCGSWEKSSSSAEHTPGSSNGSAAGASGSLTTSESWSCGLPRFVLFDITAVTGDVTEADDFPVTVQVWADMNNSGTLDAPDLFVNQKTQALISSPSDTVQMTGLYTNARPIVVYKTKRGCFDKVVAVPGTCIILPVNFKSFTAVRNGGNVNLRWETMTEQNNSGFAVERKTSSGWEQVAFVPSQAMFGNSASLLTYTYIDANAFKGISQYRIRQIDFDNRSTTSEVKAVRGENNKIQLLVYPNPSNNGMVNVVFEDGSAIRDVTLSDMAGRVISQMKGISNNNIQFENLFPGVYSLRVVDRETGEQNVQKIVVNKR